jgi:hypothetical protein
LWSFSSWLLLSFIGKPFQAHPSADQCFVKAYPASMLNVCLNVAQVMLIPLLAAPLRGWEYACTPAQKLNNNMMTTFIFFCKTIQTRWNHHQIHKKKSEIFLFLWIM